MSSLALLGGPAVRDSPWPAWPVFGADDERALLEALRAGDWGGFPLPNRYAAPFAEDFAARHDCEFALCVANGTVSLEIALQAAQVEPGAEVIVPAYTFEATASAALFSGCVPIFADVCADTYCIDPQHVEALIGPRTQAILPVHLAMTCADLDALTALCERHGLVLIEDCAHAHGARWRGRGVGSWGAAGSFSCQTSKLLTAGEGGIVTCSDPAVLDRAYALTNCGRQRPGRDSDAPLIGHNYRMTDLQAALLTSQFGRLDDQLEHRLKQARRVRAAIDDIDGLCNLHIDDRVTTQAIYQFVARYDPEDSGTSRDAIVAALQAEGVPCDGVFYEAVPQSSLFQMDAARYPAWAESEHRPHCPVAERAAYSESIWLPHQLLLGTDEDTDQLIEALRKVMSHRGDLAGVDHGRIREQGVARTARSSSR